MVKGKKLTDSERGYVAYLKNGSPSSSFDAHEVARCLYEFYQPIGTVEAGLYLLWFSVFTELTAHGENIKNSAACAAAVEYLWNKLRREKVSQKEIAGRYGLSSATLGKYVKMVKEYLN